MDNNITYDKKKFEDNCKLFKVNYPDVNLEELLEDRVNNLIQLSDKEYSDNDYMELYNIELNKLIEEYTKPTKNKKNVGAIDPSYEGKSSNNKDNETKERDSKVKAALLLASKFVFKANTIDSHYYYVEKCQIVVVILLLKEGFIMQH